MFLLILYKKFVMPPHLNCFSEVVVLWTAACILMAKQKVRSLILPLSPPLKSRFEASPDLCMTELQTELTSMTELQIELTSLLVNSV